jgi:hypothetical protein
VLAYEYAHLEWEAEVKVKIGTTDETNHRSFNDVLLVILQLGESVGDKVGESEGDFEGGSVGDFDGVVVFHE